MAEEADGSGKERTRSEYRLSLPVVGGAELMDAVRRLGPDDLDAVAVLMLDAYRGTVDDEGETMVEALEAAEFLIDDAELSHSWAIDGDGVALAVCVVNHFHGVHYVNLIAVAAEAKRRGLGRALVAHALVGLHEAGVAEVGAAITDGNVASEGLFASLGATRVGPWPPADT